MHQIMITYRFFFYFPNLSKAEKDSFFFYCMLFDSFSISFDFFRHFFNSIGVIAQLRRFYTNSQLKCLTERIRFFVLTKPSEVRRTGGTLNGTRQSQSEKDGARIKPF